MTISYPTPTQIPSTQLVLPRYERPKEEERDTPALDRSTCIAFADSDRAIAGSSLSAGGQEIAHALLRLGTTRMFGGGGVGIEYGSLLKTAVRPDLIGAHVHEAGEYLRDLAVDLLLVPGMSGYPVGAMYSIASGIPAVLLKKVRYWAEAPTSFPTGAFVIPSYTGEGDVVMFADQDALQDIVDRVCARQITAQPSSKTVALSLRVAGADDIIDKATMSHAVSESALVVGRGAIERFVRRHRAVTGDNRPMSVDVQAVAWVTPLIKGYNRPVEYMRRTIGIIPFAGLTVSSVHLDPPAIGIDGVGVVVFPGG